ncbi:hypothetical protein HCJ66_01835 [Listeria sp. FSL L7-1582]|uniref:hypothetical protein n=1 Tax=Listeria portnoyi TaxID=2713504 RepID=UPI00164EB2D2|nr:hypothetical protein [Listeria portnoyi]MBC6308284.1 hypothetical protein [Listeria portnoyi]
MDTTKEMRLRFHVLGYFLVSLLFVGAGLMLGASGVSDSIVTALFSFAKYMILSLIVSLFLIMVRIARAHL